MTHPQPWERQTGEGARAFAAFQSYRDQPSNGRSLRRLAIDLGRTLRPLAEWSTRWQWRERVAAWDAEQDRVLRAAFVTERRRLARRLAASGALMQAKGLAKIRSFVDRVDVNGEAVALRPGESYIDQLSLASAVRMIVVGSRLEMMGRGGLDEQPLGPGQAVASEALGLALGSPILAAPELNPVALAEATAALSRLLTPPSPGDRAH